MYMPVDELPTERRRPAGCRSLPGGRAARAGSALPDVVCVSIAKERGDVARHGVAEAHHQRIFRRIDQLVELVGLRTRRTGRCRWCVGTRLALSGRAAAVRPAVCRDRRLRSGARCCGRSASRRRCWCRLSRRRRTSAAFERQGKRARAGNRAVRILDAHGRDDRAAVAVASLPEVAETAGCRRLRRRPASRRRRTCSRGASGTRRRRRRR